LFFASPFFQAALSGDWAETGRPASMSSIITISQPPSVPGSKGIADAPTAMTFAPVEPEPDELVDDSKTKPTDCGPSIDSDASPDESEQIKARDCSLNKLEGNSSKEPGPSVPQSNKDKPSSNCRKTLTLRKRPDFHFPEAVIILKEEKVCPSCCNLLFHNPDIVRKASTFHDFLRFVYPK
jgi:hypothetical protein